MTKRIAFGLLLPILGIAATIAGSVGANFLCKETVLLPQNVEQADEAVDYHGFSQDATDPGGHAIAPYYSYKPCENDIPDFQFSELRGMLSYKTGDVEVRYHVRGGKDTIETAIVDGKKKYQSLYNHNDDKVDMLTFGKNAIAFSYEDDGKLSFLCANDLPMQFLYEDDRLSEAFIGDDFGKILYQYDSLGPSFYQGIGAASFQKDAIAKAGTTNVSIGRSIAFSYDSSAQAEFFVQGKQTKYVSSFVLEGKEHRLSYFQGKVVMLDDGFEKIVYVLDSNGNYLGCVYNGNYYLFVFDGAGLLRQVIDEFGNPILIYDVNPFGGVTIYGEDVAFSRLNCVLGLNLFGCPRAGVLFDGQRIYCSPEQASYSIRDFSKATMGGNDWLTKSSAYIEKAKTLGLTSLEGTIITDLRKRLSVTGFSVYENVSVTKDDGSVLEPLHLYFSDLNDESRPNLNNLRHQNSGYYLASKQDSAQEAFALAKEKKAKAKYLEPREFSPATYEIDGDLFYLGYAVHYEAKDGLISYSLRPRDGKNILSDGNVYDYDRDRYLQYRHNAISLGDLQFERIVPGLSKESYEAINSFVDDQFQLALKMEYDFVSGIDQSELERALVYDTAGDTTPLLVNDVDEGAYYVAVDAGGGIKIATLPWYENKESIKAFAKIGAVVAAVALANVVSIYFPGAGVYIMPITISFVKGFVGSFVANGLFAAYDIIKCHDDPGFNLDIAIAESFNQVTNKALVDGAKAAVSTFVKMQIAAVAEKKAGVTELKRTIASYDKDFKANGYGGFYDSDIESYEYYMHYQMEYTRGMASLKDNSFLKHCYDLNISKSFSSCIMEEFLEESFSRTSLWEGARKLCEKVLG